MSPIVSAVAIGVRYSFLYQGARFLPRGERSMWWTEFRCQSRNPNQFESAGSIRLHTDDENIRKPAWLVAAKMLALVAMFIVGFAVIMPSVPLPSWPAAILTGGALLVYVGVAFFIRPDPNTDNMGWLGGTMDDRYQYNDDINRMLWSLHCVLVQDDSCLRRSLTSSRCAA